MKLARFILLATLLVLGHVANASEQQSPLDNIEHIILIYLENWSFDSLFGHFPGANNLLTEAAKNSLPQENWEGQVYETLPPDPDNRMPAGLPNTPFDFNIVLERMPKNASWPGIPITHRYYFEQWQINDGKMNRFVNFSSAEGITMSYFDVTNQYFGQLAQNYTLLDNFYHSAFGGSFLNHQFLIAGRAPFYPEYMMTPEMKQQLVATFNPVTGYIENDGPISPEFLAVNHIESMNPPLNPRTPPLFRLPSQNHTTIGDLLSNAGVSWRWYAGGYYNAMYNGDEPLHEYQYHHQPFVFFDRFKDPESWDRREHLKDETDLLADLKNGNLPRVSMYKPYGEDNFHPGYSSVYDSEAKLREIVTAVQNSKYWEKSAIVITFDENGGRWDHVAPPKGDIWGPGTRIPAVIVSPWVKKGFIDSNQYETLSFVKWVEEFGKVNGTVIAPTRQNNIISLGKVFIDANVQPPVASTAPEMAPQEVLPPSDFIINRGVPGYVILIVALPLLLAIVALMVYIVRSRFRHSQEALMHASHMDYSTMADSEDIVPR